MQLDAQRVQHDLQVGTESVANVGVHVRLAWQPRWSGSGWGSMGCRTSFNSAAQSLLLPAVLRLACPTHSRTGDMLLLCQACTLLDSQDLSPPMPHPALPVGSTAWHCESAVPGLAASDSKSPQTPLAMPHVHSR